MNAPLNIFEKAEYYLRQQKEVFGDTIYLEPFQSAICYQKDEPQQVLRNIAPIVEMRQVSLNQDTFNGNFNPQTISDRIAADGITIKSSDSVPQNFLTQNDDFQNEDWQNATTIEQLRSSVCNCQKCPLSQSRNKFVFGYGNPNADVVVIGEAPGAEEDKQGLPFVGRAGQLLTKILEAIQLSREDVFICNILKCRPPENRQPLPTEIEVCEPYLKKQLALIKPAFILALGLTAVNTLLKAKHTMADIRGQLFDYSGVKMLVTYHPAALLRNSNLKAPVWQDVKLLRSMINEYKERQCLYE